MVYMAMLVMLLRCWCVGIYRCWCGVRNGVVAVVVAVVVVAFFFFSRTFTSQLLDKLWSQVSSLSPPGSRLHFFYRA